MGSRLADRFDVHIASATITNDSNATTTVRITGIPGSIDDGRISTDIPDHIQLIPKRNKKLQIHR
jgi:hypothetical protein